MGFADAPSNHPAVLALIGSGCFGVVVGFITYRCLKQLSKTSVADLAAVIVAIGGGTVTTLLGPATGELFGAYAIGLVAGMAMWLILNLILPADKTRLLGRGDVKQG